MPSGPILLLISYRSFLFERQPQGPEYFSTFYDGLKAHMKDISALTGCPGTLALAKVALVNAKLVVSLPKTQRIAKDFSSLQSATLRLLYQEIDNITSKPLMPLQGPGHGIPTPFFDLAAGFNETRVKETLSEPSKILSHVL